MLERRQREVREVDPDAAGGPRANYRFALGSPLRARRDGRGFINKNHHHCLRLFSPFPHAALIILSFVPAGLDCDGRSIARDGQMTIGSSCAVIKNKIKNDRNFIYRTRFFRAKTGTFDLIQS